MHAPASFRGPVPWWGPVCGRCPMTPERLDVRLAARVSWPSDPSPTCPPDVERGAREEQQKEDQRCGRVDVPEGSSGKYPGEGAAGAMYGMNMCHTGGRRHVRWCHIWTHRPEQRPACHEQRTDEQPPAYPPVKKELSPKAAGLARRKTRGPPRRSLIPEPRRPATCSEEAEHKCLHGEGEDRERRDEPRSRGLSPQRRGSP